MKLLQGKTILVTRDLSQAEGIKKKLEAEGAEIVCIPTIVIVDPPDCSSFDEAAQKAGEINWIVFTSVNAVKHTLKRLTVLSIALQNLSHLKVAVVGNQTAEEVLKAGWEVKLKPEKFQSENLLEEFLKLELSGRKIWIPGALETRDVLADGLRQAGVDVFQTPVYQTTIPMENRAALINTLEKKTIDWITFTSPSTVRNFVQMLGNALPLEGLPKLASIGAVTSKALAEFELVPVFTADPQNIDGLVAGILENERIRTEP